MKALAIFVMRGRTQAVITASVLTVLSMIIPPLSYLSGAIVGLVTLRHGPRDGVILAAISALIVAGLAGLTLGNGLYALVFLVVVWLPIWLASIVLRQSISLGLALITVAGLGLILVAGFHIVVGDTISFWREIVERVTTEAWANLPVMDREQLTTDVAQMATALLGATFMLSVAVSLFIARWWQATLFNPGGFGQEFRALRLNRAGAVITVCLLALALATGQAGDMLNDLTTVLIMLYAFPGLALFHDWTEKTSASNVWLVALYIMLLFAAPQVLTVLSIMGMGDSWGDFRKHYSQ